MTVAERKRRQTLIDEYAELVREKKKLEEKLASRKAEIFACLPENHPASEPYTLTGKKWILLIKAAKWTREITSLQWVLERVGLEAFMGKCTLPLKAFDELIPEAERSQYCTREQNGAREIEPVQKNP